MTQRNIVTVVLILIVGTIFTTAGQQKHRQKSSQRARPSRRPLNRQNNAQHYGDRPRRISFVTCSVIGNRRD